MPKIPKLQRDDIEGEDMKVLDNGIIEIKIKDKIAKKAYISAAVDISGFYKEFGETLKTNWENIEFLDMHGKPSEKKKGNYLNYEPEMAHYKDPGGDLTRPQGIFEHHYVWAKHNGFEEHETRWHARCPAKYSKYGWIEFKMQIDVRNLVAREVLVGNKKKKLYYGTWEFRNEMKYKNKVIVDFLHTIPYVKNSPKLQQIYLDYSYYKNLTDDVLYAKNKLIPLFYSVIHKYFRNE